MVAVTIEEQKIAQLDYLPAKYRRCQGIDAMDRINISMRLKEERQRLELSQVEMAELGDISTRTQAAWEKGEQSPSADYLARVAAKGADVLYVITGRREQPLTAEALSTAQVEELQAFAGLGEAPRAAVLNLLQVIKNQ